MNDRIDELLHLIEVEPDALREAEFLQAQAILETMIGKTIASADIDETRIVVTTTDGNKYFFYGFLGSGADHEAH
jgi:superfamily I DNA and RNA helicase